MDGNPVERRVKVERSSEPELPRPGARTEPATEATAEVDATDAAERKAEELSVDRSEVEGSGAEGRVLVEDVEEAAGEDGDVQATEAAERKAEELGVDISTVEGTGQDGRITVGDVEKAGKESE
ncbi:MAG: E3 binding domain-containing protein [Rubrobacter sp.]